MDLGDAPGLPGAAAGLLGLVFVVHGSVLLGWLILDFVLGYAATHSYGFRGWEWVNDISSALFFSLGFTFCLRSLPRDRLTWKDAFPGGCFTGIGFAVSKFLLGFYFARVSGVYNAAGGVVILLLWMYYSSMIYFLGVEVTYIYSHKYGSLKAES